MSTTISSDFKHFLQTSTPEDLAILSRFTANLAPVEVRALSREIQRRSGARRATTNETLKTKPDRENYDGIAQMLRHSVEFHLEQEAQKNGAGDVQG